MKIIFLHLSDSHFSTKEEIKGVKLNKIIDSLKELDSFDKCILVYSGDLTFSGTLIELDMIKSFIKELCKQIKSTFKLTEFVETLIVPGNHDLDFSKIGRDRINYDCVKKAYKNKDNFSSVNKIFARDKEGLINFCHFARYFGCFKDGNSIVDHRLIKFDNLSFDICLLSTAPLSICESSDDMRYHYLSSYDIQKIIPSEESDIRILVIHHPEPWFCWQTNNELNKLVSTYYDIVFQGHEHSYKSEVKIVNNDKQIIYLEAAALYENNVSNGYSCAILDTNSLRFTEYKYVWNGQIYASCEKKDVDTYLTRQKNLNPDFRISKEYLEKLKKEPSENLKVDITKYFSFPVLSYYPNNDVEKDEKNIISMDEFCRILEKEKRLLIQGNGNSGKTTLCNLFCLKIMEEKVPVLVRGEEIAKGAKIDNVIKSSLFEMYTSYNNTLYNEYLQLNKSKKVLIVDNINAWSNTSREKAIDYLSNKYEYIVMFSDTDWNFDIIQRTIASLSENDFLKMKIDPFYYERREELIKNVLKTISQDYNKSDVKIINEYIHNQSRYCPREPEFIIQLIKYYTEYGSTFYDDKQNVFSIVYENDLYNRIRECTNICDISEIFTALEEISYNMHFNNKTSMNFNDMNSIICNYNKICDEEIKPLKIYNVCIQSKIFRETEEQDTIVFRDQRTFAYFVARCLVKKRNVVETYNDINLILENMCKGINGDIMLFLAYLTRDISILECIIKCAKTHANNWIEFSFEKGDNIEGKLDYLKYVNKKEKFKLPTNKDKENAKKAKDEVERKSLTTSEEDVPAIYGNEESVEDIESIHLIKAIKLLELIAKMLPNFSGTFISASFKKECVDIIYSYPNKIVYRLFGDIDTNLVKNIERIQREVPEIAEKIGNDPDSISKELAMQTLQFILAIYNFASKLATNGKTLRVLDKHETNKITTCIQNLFMHIDNGSFDSFYDKIFKAYRENDDQVIHTILKYIARQYFISNDVEIYGNAQKLISNFFGENEVQPMKNELYKRRALKKD